VTHILNSPTYADVGTFGPFLEYIDQVRAGDLDGQLPLFVIDHFVFRPGSLAACDLHGNTGLLRIERLLFIEMQSDAYPTLSRSRGADAANSLRGVQLGTW
jgi:hypothetical protein